MAVAVVEELRLVVSIVVPVLAQLGLNVFGKSASLAFVGHYDPAPETVAAAAVGSMYGSITGLSVGIGMTLVVGSYCAQNSGRGATVENGVVVRHCFSAHVLCFVFALSMAELAPSLLRAFEQPEELFQPVRRFATISAFAWPGNWIFVCLSTALSSQNWQGVGLVGQMLSSSISFGLSWWCLSHGTGFLGIAFVNIVASWASVAFIVAYIVVRGRQHAVWRVPPVVSAAGQVTLGQYLCSAIPMAASMWVEWWALEIMALFAGWLPGRQTSVAAHSILFNLLTVLYMAFVAVSRACMFRVGHRVGARDVPGIGLSIRVCVLVSIALSCMVAGVLEASGDRLTRLYTDNEAILEAADPAMLGVVLSVPPYAVMMCLMGALRSAGLQLWGAQAVFVSYYLVGLPAGYYLGVVRGVGLLGIWFGNVAALSCGALLCLVKVSRIDWGAVIGPVTGLKSPTLGCLSEPASAPLLRQESPGRWPSVEHSGLATSCCLRTSETGDAPEYHSERS